MDFVVDNKGKLNLSSAWIGPLETKLQVSTDTKTFECISVGHLIPKRKGGLSNIFELFEIEVAKWRNTLIFLNSPAPQSKNTVCAHLHIFSVMEHFTNTA